jgi:RNA-binding protein
MLTSKQKQFLKGLAHDLKPVILVGNKGVTDALIKETRGALHAHELIKVRLADGELDDVATEIAQKSGAELVDRIGKMAIVYKPHPEERTIKLPK